MRRVLLAIVFTTVACGSLLAQDFEQLDRCLDKATTQLAIHICADAEAKRVDAELNRIYQQLLSAARDEPGAVEKIRAVERVWIAYRDAYLDAMYPAKNKLAAYGSSFTTENLLLRAKLTQQQTNALREMLKRYSGLQ